MKALLQRVSQASVSIDGVEVARIGAGLLVLVGIEPDDNQQSLEKMLHKLLNYRVFADEQERMNKSLTDIQGGLLLVSQFTLAADTRSGLRPGFSTAASARASRSAVCSNWCTWLKNVMPRCRRGSLVRICRCNWSTMDL